MTGKLHLVDSARPFLAYLEDWYDHLPSMPLEDIVHGEPEKVALMSVDMVNGFCKEGPLSGERVGALTGPVAAIFHRAYNLGVRSMVLTQDTHDPNTPEFKAYPPHCVAGTSESETISELKNLPFFNELKIVTKNSLSSHIGTDLDAWVQERPQVQTFIVVGDCTDLCVYSSAMHLRLQANAFNLVRRVIVPSNLVDTYEMHVSEARAAGIKAHEAELHHALFLHHMALNGIDVIKELT